MEDHDISGLTSYDVRYTLSPDRPKTFKGQLDRLQAQRDTIPAGWLSIFDRAMHKLRGVDCPKRDGMLLDEIHVEHGELGIDVLLDVGDRAVYGILKALRRRSRCTCQDCGRGIGAAYRWESRKTQCVCCHVDSELKAALAMWLDDGYTARLYRNRLFVGMDELPENVRLLINRSKIKKHTLSLSGVEFHYVEPDVILALCEELKVIRTYYERQQAA